MDTKTTYTDKGTAVNNEQRNSNGQRGFSIRVTSGNLVATLARLKSQCPGGRLIEAVSQHMEEPA